MGTDWTFFFDADASGAAPPPMPVMPSTELMEMQRLTESRASGVTFTMSAEVFVYRGQNFALPRAFTVVTLPRKDAAAPTPAAPAKAVDPAAGDLVRSMDTPRTPRPPARSRQDADIPANLRREGEFIKSRKARLERETATRWRLVFDSGPSDPAATREPPMRPLPCLTLERMEAVAQRFGESVPMIVSGQVLLYEGENYLLPTMLTLEYADVGEIKPTP